MSFLNEIEKLGNKLISMEPSVVQKYRILKDIIGIDRDSVEFIEARHRFLESDQYLEVESAREEYGMWGRFHTENTSVKRKFKTTEVAMKRCKSLGLDKDDRIIKKLLRSIIGIISGKIIWPDSIEVTNVWMDIGFRWSLTGGLVQFDRFNPLLDKPWNIIAELISGSFKSEGFRQQDHDYTFMKLAVNALSKAQVKRLATIQFIGTKYFPLIIGATNNKLPYDIEKAYINWLIDSPKGTYGISNCSYDSMPSIHEGGFMAYMRIHSLLNPFRAWKENYGNEVLDSLRNAAGDDGLWYPGSGAKSLYALKNYEKHQLADNWRRPEAAKIDFSIFILDFIKKAL